MRTAEQEGALQAVKTWFRSTTARRRPFRLTGLAGTGKTTLAREFAEMVDGAVMFGAYTGKAASVLRSKGCPGATTIHSLIYRPAGSTHAQRVRELEELIAREMTVEDGKRNEQFISGWRNELEELKAQSKSMWKLQEEAEIMGADLVIIDEHSMVDLKMQEDLESFGIPLLCLGDPGQLPPVGGRSALSAAPPDYHLTEIHRQAADSPIITLAHKIREGYEPHIGCFGVGVDVRRKDDFDWDEVLEAGQVICGMNATRRRLNKVMRKKLGRDKLYPVQGDKLICLQNNHDEGLLNGVTCEATGEAVKTGAILTLDLLYEGQEMRHYADPGHFEENYGRRVSFPRHDAVEHFDFGYAITGHKSQGSQWDSVVVCDDRMKSDDLEFRKRWLYTVVTRAAEDLTIYV